MKKLICFLPILALTLTVAVIAAQAFVCYCAVPSRKLYEPHKNYHFVEIDAAVYGRHKSKGGFDLPWLSTGIFLKEGTSVSISAKGFMFVSGFDFQRLSQSGQFDPDGSAEKIGLLRARIKPKDEDLNYFNYRAVGKYWEYTTKKSDGDGVLELNIQPAIWITDAGGRLWADWATPVGKYRVEITIED